MAIAYQFYADGYFASAAEDFGLQPNNSTYTQPPARPWTNRWPKWVDGEWVMVEDHRERSVQLFGEDAQPATEYWLPEDNWQSQPRKMTEIGPLPTGAILERPEKPAERVFEDARRAIDSETSSSILAGFDYEVDGEILHFSYDSFDQQNFADTANACLMQKSGAENLPATVTWNAYKKDGSLVRLELTADEFLALYAGGALAHKAICMAAGGEKKAALELEYAG